MNDFVEMSDAELRQAIRDNKDILIEEIIETKVLTSGKFKRGYASAKQIWDIAHGIDKETRAENQQASSNIYTEEQLALRAKIQQSKAFNSRTDPNHKQAVKAWQGTHIEQQDNGEGNNNGE